MTELEFLSQYVRWSLGIGGGVLIIVLGAIWLEIRNLRNVRHDDREMIAKVSVENDILSREYKELVDDQKAQLEELKRENGIMKYMLKNAGKDAEITFL